jgi:phosphatidylglycerophosphatase A
MPIHRRAVVALATGLGLGFSPVASGTVGSLLGVAIVGGMQGIDSLLWQAVLAVALCFLAVPICDVAESHFGKKDDGRIVADEYLTFPICMLGLPFSMEYWWVVPMCFVTNRMFDILKPPPAHALQRLRGGWGIVVDDVIAACYSLALNHLLYYLVAVR